MTCSRRRFLASTSAIAASAPLINVQAFSARPGSVVTETGVPESRAFASIVEPSARIDCQLGDVMRLENELNEALRSGRQILGATQEAGALVIEELLRGQPYRLDIIGRHRQIHASIMHHEVSGLALPNGRALFENFEWPARLAQTLMNLSEVSTQHTVRFDVALSRPIGSPGYVTTWRIART